MQDGEEGARLRGDPSDGSLRWTPTSIARQRERSANCTRAKSVDDAASPP